MARLLGILSLLPAAASAAAAVASARGCQEEGTCAVQGSSLLQAGSRVSALKDFTAAEKDDGFTIHLFNSKEASENADGVVVRPLFKKTYKCQSASPSSCSECSSGEFCFETRTGRKNDLEHMYVRSRRGNWWPWQHHRIRVNFHCPEAAQFTISSHVRLKGQLNDVVMKVDGKTATPQIFKRRGNKRSVLLTEVWNSTAGRVLELDLHFMMKRNGWAKVMDIQIKSSSEYLACQDHKACLKVLEGSDEGLQLRNDNLQQLMCLDGMLANNTACSEWKACLDSSMSTDRIRTLLLAAGVKETADPPESSVALPQVEVETSSEQADEEETEVEGEEKEEVSEKEEDDEEQEEAEEEQKAQPIALNDLSKQTPSTTDYCIDPRIDDPESWLCSCLDAMEETCLAVSNSFQPEEWSSQNCLTAQMCLDPKGVICGAWKEAVGCNGTKYTELITALDAYITETSAAPAAEADATSDPVVALQRRARGVQQKKRRGDATMDGSLSGKSSACE